MTGPSLEDIVEAPTSNSDLDSSSFGIKKIIDCRINQEGKQMYKVRWEETWEPADSLITCQHLVDDFWSRVNKAKRIEHIAKQVQQLGKRGNADNAVNRLSSESKADVHNLIARTNLTSVGNGKIISPSSKLMKLNEINSSKPSSINSNSLSTPKIKTETKPPTSSKSFDNSSLKYLENFDNPYVKVIVVCKVCNKEASKSTAQWKVHYLTHVSEEERPFKCELCGKGFVQKIHLQNHMKKHVKQQQKQEQQQQFHQQYMQQFDESSPEQGTGMHMKMEYPC